MGRLNDVKMASFLYGLITFYKDVMETLYNVPLTLLFCLNDVKMASFLYGLITFYKDVMETL